MNSVFHSQVVKASGDVFVSMFDGLVLKLQHQKFDRNEFFRTDYQRLESRREARGKNRY